MFAKVKTWLDIIFKQEFDKVIFFILIKNVTNARGRKDNLEIIGYEKTAGKICSNVNQEMRHKKYYKRKAHTNFDWNCDSKIIDRLF